MDYIETIYIGKYISNRYVCRSRAGAAGVAYRRGVPGPRSTNPRGTRVRGESTAPRAARAADLPPSEPVADPTAPRGVIEYALQRRALLTALFGGRAFDGLDVCDADPYLLKAARFHGVTSADRCPVCRKADLVHVTYVYGDQLGHVSGSAVDPMRLDDLALRTGEFRVYVVEVCTECRWNHLVTSYSLGDGVSRRAPARPRDLLD